MAGFTKYISGRFKWVHASWAALGLGASLVLIFAGGEGHPPAIVLLPLALVIWVVGHVALLAIAWLVLRGAPAEVMPGRWPAGVIIALIGTGVVGSLGVVQVVVTLVLGDWYPFQGALWFIALGVALVHAAAFVGTLLRRAWARATAAGVSFGWAFLLSRQIVDHLTSAYRINVAELALALACIAALVVLGTHLWRSQRIKAFLKAR